MKKKKINRFNKINDIIRKKGKAAKSMTVGELAEEIS